jgi:hypothetical protein
LLLGALAGLHFGCGNGEPEPPAAAAESVPQVDAGVMAGLERDVEQALAVWEVPGAAVVVVSRNHVLYGHGPCSGFRRRCRH